MVRKKQNFEEQFRQAILNSGMSRYRLAELTGVSDGVLSNFVTGKRSLTLTTAVKIAKVLKLEIRKIDER